MSNEQAPETNGVTTEVLATVDLGPEIEGMAGRQLRMRMVTIEAGGVFGPVHDHKDRPGIVYVRMERSPTIETGSRRTTGRERAGRRTGTRHTGSRTEERYRRWRSPSTSSGTTELGTERDFSMKEGLLSRGGLGGRGWGGGLSGAHFSIAPSVGGQGLWVCPLRWRNSVVGRLCGQSLCGAYRGKRLVSVEHVPDRFAEAAGEVDLCDFGASLSAEPGFGALVAVVVGGMFAGVGRCLNEGPAEVFGAASGDRA